MFLQHVGIFQPADNEV